MLIFDQSSPGRANGAQLAPAPAPDDLPAALLRASPPPLPQVSELQAVRHYTRLSQKNFSIDTHFYPLGSCTMKYNPRAANELALRPVLRDRHPLAPAATGQGFLACLWELQDILARVTGMAGVSLTPLAGAQGELAGIAMIEAYHRSRGDTARREILVPDAAHGTNPATAVMCGYSVREIPTDAQGDVDLTALRAAVGPVHEAGGLLYYDGANLNAILGHARPGDMGFDVVHLNLHKTFATPHGGGGPGAGPVGVSERLLRFLPVPMVARDGDRYRWLSEVDRPQSIGRLSAFAGNAGILMRAWVYIRLLGREGMRRVAEFATLNAAYLQARLREAGFELAFPDRRASHEFIVTLRRSKQDLGVSALDIAKRLLDYGYHAPTVYFPLLVPECLLIEPTETESVDMLDGFVAALVQIAREAREQPELLHAAPHTLPVRRLDEVRAARQPDLAWRPA